MYSKVRVAGHPLHPMLVGFPVTLYTVTVGCFVAYASGADAFWFRVAVYANAAAVVMAVAAAIPGFIDWAFGVPAGTPAKSTGLAHMAFNVLALLAFALNSILHWSHRNDVVPTAGTAIALSALGLGLTLVAGFLGWKMVQTHHVGVDLTAEQRRFEPRGTSRIEHHETTHGSEHGHRIG